MKKAALSQADWHTIKKFLAGGAAIGGGLGLVTSLANYLKNLKQEADEETTQDDSTLYVNVGAPPALGKAAAEEGPSLMRGGVAMAGATLGGIGAYALVRKAYQALKKQQLQEELDSVQQVYTDMLQEEADSNNAVKRTRRSMFAPQLKSAAAVEDRPMSGTEKLFSTPIALTLLMGLASAAVTNQALKKSFPIKTKPSRLTPKRVVIRTVPKKDDPPATEAETDEIAEASEPALDEFMPEKSADFHDAVEYLLDFTATIPGEGMDVSNLLKAATAGRYGEMRASLLHYGPEFMLDGIKGACLDKSAAAADPGRHMMAVSLIARSSTVGPVASIVAAAEFNEAFPGLTKYAAGLDENIQEALVGVLAGFRRVQRHDMMAGREGVYFQADGSKSAASLSELFNQDALLEKILEAGLENGGKKDVSPGDGSAEGLLGSDDENSSTDVDVQDQRAGEFADGNKDLIDQVLSPGKSGGKAPYLVFADKNNEANIKAG